MRNTDLARLRMTLPLLCLILLAGCGRWLARPAPLPSSPPSTAAAATTPTATSRPAATVAPATETPAPTALAPEPLIPAALETGDMAPYLAALRPEAAAGLDLAGLTRYHLALALPVDLAELTGKAQIRYTNREGTALDRILLHLYPNLWGGGMTVTDVRVDGVAATVTPLSGDAMIAIALPSALAPAARVDLTLRFAVPVPGGEGVGNYGEFAYQDGILALAHFYPTVAVYDETGWRTETPAPMGDVIFHDASLYEVTLTAPAALTISATGAILGRDDRRDGTATWRLAGGPLRDFNIAASADYRSASTAVGDVVVNSYFLAADEEGGRDALAWATRALALYQDAFGPYPYRELDIVATGTRAAGIEYPGLIAIAQRLYSDPERRTLFESATVHEVAHQWWYNVVGNDQINDPWLDEALAQYSTYLYFRDAYGTAGAEGFVQALNDRWARIDFAEKPVGLPVAAYDPLEYSAIVYGRGPLFLLALRDQIGETNMAALLRRYYAEQAWDIATPAEFRALAREVGGTEVDALFAQWVDAPK